MYQDYQQLSVITLYILFFFCGLVHIYCSYGVLVLNSGSLHIKPSNIMRFVLNDYGMNRTYPFRQKGHGRILIIYREIAVSI